MKKLTTLAAMLALALMVAAQASAQTIVVDDETSVGAITITDDDFGAGFRFEADDDVDFGGGFGFDADDDDFEGGTDDDDGSDDDDGDDD